MEAAERARLKKIAEEEEAERSRAIRAALDEAERIRKQRDEIE